MKRNKKANPPKKGVLTQRGRRRKSKFTRFMEERGFPLQLKTPEYTGWVTFVQGGSPGLGKKR